MAKTVVEIRQRIRIARVFIETPNLRVWESTCRLKPARRSACGLQPTCLFHGCTGSGSFFGFFGSSVLPGAGGFALGVDGCGLVCSPRVGGLLPTSTRS